MWELYEAWPGLLCGRPDPLGVERCDAISAELVARLETIGFFRMPGQVPETREFLRDVMARASLTASEADFFTALFNKLTGLAQKRG
jgi:tRNA C32,U32 (ribose-2'-O)-methylase TrmJ